MYRIGAPALLLSLTACASGSGSGQTAAGFPTARSLAALASAPTPALDDLVDYHHPDTWTAPGPIPAGYTMALHPQTTPWGQLLVQRTAPSGGAVVASAAMHCVAQGIAAFLAEFGKAPSPAVREHLLGRCRATPSAVSYRSLSGEVPDTTSDADLWAQWKADVTGMVAPPSPDRFEAIGIGFARVGGRAVYVVARGERRAVIEQVQVQGAEVVVKGRLLVPDSNLRAAIAQGAFGYAECAQDASIVNPRFELRCPVQAGDVSTWVQVASFPPGRVLGKTLLQVLLTPPEAAPTFTRGTFPGMDTEVSRATLAPAFLKAVNAVRAQAGLQPVDDEPTQSQEASRLAPHYFHASFVSHDVRAAETAFLGLRAGWQVSETVRYGQVSTSLSVGTRSLQHLLGGLLAMPFGRQTLLDPQVRRIAIGSVWEDSAQFMAVMVSTYALFGDDDPKTLAMSVFGRLNAARAARGQGPASRLAGLGDGRDAATEALDAGRDPALALQGLLRHASQMRNTGMQGYRLETHELGELVWPEEMLEQPGLQVHVSVGWHQPPDEPWGRYVVFCVYPAGRGPAI